MSRIILRCVPVIPLFTVVALLDNLYYEIQHQVLHRYEFTRVDLEWP